jgi:hypothetical protein
VHHLMHQIIHHLIHHLIHQIFKGSVGGGGAVGSGLGARCASGERPMELPRKCICIMLPMQIAECDCDAEHEKMTVPLYPARHDGRPGRGRTGARRDRTDLRPDRPVLRRVVTGRRLKAAAAREYTCPHHATRPLTHAPRLGSCCSGPFRRVRRSLDEGASHPSPP